MIGEEYKKVSIINEHIPKHQVESDNKPKECVSLKKGRRKPWRESMLNSSSDKDKLKWCDKGDATDTQTRTNL